MLVHVVVAVLEKLNLLPLKMLVLERVAQYHEATDVDYPCPVL